MSRQLPAFALLIGVAACTRVGAPPPSPVHGAPEAPAAESRSLSGIVTLGGQRLPVALDLRVDGGGQGTAHLEIPDLPLQADETATDSGIVLELDMQYGGACPGDLAIRARRTDGTGPLEGTLTARDCTGEASGLVVLEVTQVPTSRPTRMRLR